MFRDDFSDERLDQIDHYETLDLAGQLELERESPHDVDLLVRIGRHFLRERKLAKTQDYYSRALEIDPDDAKSKERLDEWLANKPA